MLGMKTIIGEIEKLIQVDLPPPRTEGLQGEAAPGSGKQANLCMTRFPAPGRRHDKRSPCTEYM